jgi:hypothetical protein
VGYEERPVKIYLASAGVPESHSAIRAWQAAAAQDRIQHHVLVDDPDGADMVLFTECHQLGNDWRLSAIRDAPVTRRLRDKVYVYDQRDRPWCALPGAYVSMPARYFERRFQVASAYVPVRGAGLAEPQYRLTTPDLLLSFVGSPTHPVREKLFGLQYPCGVFARIDDFLFFDPASRDYVARQQFFLETLVRSKFVLCPRGHGTSSFRLYEAVAAGRVPVIIADDWVPPRGPSWDTFSVRWPENAPVEHLLERLEALEANWKEMGRHAFDAFSEWFSPSVIFDRIASDLAALAAGRNESRFPARGLRGRGYRRLLTAQYAGRVRAAAKSWGARR